MAVPVQQNVKEGPLVAVIILTVQAPPVTPNPYWPVILWVVPLTGLILLVAVAPFGALFGLIMSRGLTRRLKALTLAADAWSEGDFSVQPQDRSRDEISYLGMRMRRMAEHVQALLQSQHALALLEERNRLARELHDTVRQETFATLMQVRAAKNLLDSDPAAARERLTEAEELIKTSQQELGRIITELRPTALEGQGLAGALSDYLATWSQHARIPADLQVQNDQRLPMEVEQTLFRVAQEALSNVARHSRASAATVWLVFEPGQVILYVVDNGVGFDPATAGDGFGLQSMRDRMAAVQGRLIVQAAPEGGTIVTASAPTNFSGAKIIMEDAIRVVLVDDHNMVRMGLKAYFSTLPDIQVVGEAGTGEEAVRLAADLAPDVVLMDLIMPGMDGVEATRQVKRISPRTQVIVVTSYHEDEHIFPAIRAGALSYVLKDIDPDDLADAIRRANAGEAVINPRVAARLVKELHGQREETASTRSASSPTVRWMCCARSLRARTTRRSRRRW